MRVGIIFMPVVVRLFRMCRKDVKDECTLYVVGYHGDNMFGETVAQAMADSKGGLKDQRHSRQSSVSFTYLGKKRALTHS